MFPHLGYEGWVGLSKSEVKAKAKPFADEMGELFKRLCRSEPEMKTLSKPYVKKKWSELSYNMAQVS